MSSSEHGGRGFLVGCVALLCCVCAGGISVADCVASPPHPPSPVQLRSLILDLADERRDVATKACITLFRAGDEAIPLLLEYATDARPVAWEPPARYSGLLQPMTLGHKCLCLVESIRQRQFVHRSYAHFTCGSPAVYDDIGCAAREYRTWYDSVTDPASAEYEPQVLWGAYSDPNRSYLDEVEVLRAIPNDGGGTNVTENVGGLRAAVFDLAAADSVTATGACVTLFRAREAAVPLLLEFATDDRSVSWEPPSGAGTSMLWPMTLGEKCIYLLESIRVGRLSHQSVPGFRCGGVSSDTACATKEYRRWFESVQRGDQPPYKPAVDW